MLFEKLGSSPGRIGVKLGLSGKLPFNSQSLDLSQSPLPGCLFILLLLFSLLGRNSSVPTSLNWVCSF